MKENLSKHEWIVMEALWQHSPLFLSELMEHTEARLRWKRSTYQTYLKRMIDQGYIGYKEKRGSRAYYPLVQRAECVTRESRSIAAKMTEDSCRMFLTCMIRESGLKEEDNEQLKALIDELTQKLDGGE